MNQAPEIQRHRQPTQWAARHYSHRQEKGRECFFDGGERVFEIDLQACCIRYGRLKPGGEPLLGGHGRLDGWRLWWGRPNNYQPVKTEDFRIEAVGPETVAILLTAVDEEGMRTTTRLRFGYSAEMQSYVYDFDQTLAVSGQKPWHGTAEGMYLGIEYCNFWPSGSFNHSTAGPVETPDMEPHQRGYYGRELWPWMVYEESPGKFCAVAVNRLTRSVSENMRPCDGGIFVFGVEDVGNPTLQFLGDTGSRSILSLCHAIFDLHVSLAELGRIAPGRTLQAHYRIFDTPRTEAQAILDRAEVVREPVPWLERRFLLPRAVIPGLNRFDEPLDPYQPSGQYFWRPVHTDYQSPESSAPRNGHYPAHALWDRQAHQLVMKSPWATFLGWGLFSANYIAVKPGRRYQFRAKVDLEEVAGEGVCLAYSFFNDLLNAAGEAVLPVAPIESEHVNGSRRGVELLLETRPAPDCVIKHCGVPFQYNLLDFWVVMKGKGAVRVSEVEIPER